MSQLPASTVRTLRPQAVKPPHNEDRTRRPCAHPRTDSCAGACARRAEQDRRPRRNRPRKLIRPPCRTAPVARASSVAIRSRRSSRAPSRPALPQPRKARTPKPFYLQKQLQTQTPMVFILDDNEKIEGCIEWYDRNVIKVRNTGSALCISAPTAALSPALEFSSTSRASSICTKPERIRRCSCCRIQPSSATSSSNSLLPVPCPEQPVSHRHPNPLRPRHGTHNRRHARRIQFP